MEKENLLRMAVQARKRYLVRMMLASDFYSSYKEIEKLEEELQNLTLTELEDHWKVIKSSQEDIVE